jgi:hypothetical protein
MAPCGSGILPLLVCQSPRWRFNKVPLGIPRGSGNLNFDPGDDFGLTRHDCPRSRTQQRCQRHCARSRKIGRVGQFDVGIKYLNKSWQSKFFKTRNSQNPTSHHKLDMFFEFTPQIRVKTVDISHFQIDHFFRIKNLPRVIEKLRHQQLKLLCHFCLYPLSHLRYQLHIL